MSVSVNVGVTVAGSGTVSVGGGTEVGVSVANGGTSVPGKPHENKNRHSTNNFATKRVLDFISHHLNWICTPNKLFARSPGRRLSVNCNPLAALLKSPLRPV